MTVRIETDVQREQMWARVFLHGPSGSGKTRGAFELASRLFDGQLPIALINTEPNRGKMYADRFKLAALAEVQDDYHPERFMEALDAIERIIPGGVCILDSATHEWYGTNGITQLASRFNDWAKARPLHQRFVDRIQTAQMHMVVCCRSKMKYDQQTVMDNGREKTVVVALGVGPMQDADFQYEFSLAGSFDRASHDVEWTGHVDALEGQTTNLVTDEGLTARTLTDWLSQGTALPEAATPDQVEELRQSLLAEGFSVERIEGGFATQRQKDRGVLSPGYVEEQLGKSKGRLAAKQDNAGKAAGGAEAPAEGAEGAEAAREPQAAGAAS
jgi:hypothetical protein